MKEIDRLWEKYKISETIYGYPVEYVFEGDFRQAMLEAKEIWEKEQMEFMEKIVDTIAEGHKIGSKSKLEEQSNDKG